MSKFFDELEDAPQKKVSSAIAARLDFDNESEEDKPAVSNKEKKDEEIAKICNETTFKKAKDVEQFFKKLTKYSAHFTKKGLPQILLDFIAEVEEKKDTPAIFKQKKSKFLEKYQETEVVLNLVEEKKEKRKYLEEITKTYLIENLEKRRETLLEIEKIEDLSETEKHRINLYLISCMLEENVQGYYSDIISRMKRESSLIHTKEEEDLLKTRIGKYVRKLLKHMQILDRNKTAWDAEYLDLVEIAESLKDITTVPEEGVLEIDLFLRENADVKSELQKKEEEPDKNSALHKHEHFSMVKKLRSLPFTEALALYRAMETEKQDQEEEGHSVNVCFFRATEELGHRAFAERDFNTAMDLLELAYSNKTIWSSAETEVILEIFCLCFEKKMKERKFFEVFKKNLLPIGDNLLLLKSQDPKMEIARAFILLRLGDYKEAQTIITSIVPGFDCETLLRARAIEILLTPV
ncbi:hypothetical protein NEMIN01_0744 [Nematocida minor]|uniref:uncharacterized protein n=1 Tax=Nematocida minor TaxID=1912983 RepID=UPI0022211B1C|nr:uncharacterized protein NEMIN01_0744 [Nematocida minor]KAI5189881.1 hypothetical protein NEMIN01_0744 [Nematocida minor]